MRRFLASLFALLLIIPLAACNNDQVQKIRIAEVTRSVFYAPQYVAITEGFFEEEGLEIELTTVPGGDKTMTALISGGADVALVGSETSIYVEAQGSTDPVINFAALTQTDGTFLVARENIQNFSWDQVKDSTFLGQRKGGMPQMVGEFVLKKNDIDPHGDLNLIQNIDFANISSAFASGTGEFVQLFEPTASLFEKEGRGYIVASFGEESGKVPYTTFMTKQSFIDDNADAVEKFTRAVYKAQAWVDSHSPEEIAKSVQEFFPDTPLDLITSSIERYKNQGSYATNPVLSEEAWNNLQDIMDEAGELPKRIDYNTLVNTSIAEKVISK
ncbi:ABC transporter substrate-binding protein [Bacillus sp. JJ1566]|uniref:ABC transporter substrate-binding protein n=1 Tax=Bacillus sp. JJ1566 TaxID=3122961 RepID=UPI002FFEF430